MPEARQGLRVLYLLTDGFGGHGGIAMYNRDVLTAMCVDPGIYEVVVLPRSISREVGALPDKLTHLKAAAGGAVAYARALLAVLRSGHFDLVYCAHINLAPLAWLAAKVLRAPWLLALYGIDAWNAPARPFSRWASRRSRRRRR